MAERSHGSIAERWLNNSGRLFTPFWILVSGLLIAWGWQIRNDGLLSPEGGAGYWLGIVGVTMILLLLTYSLRKRVKALSHLFNIRSWFQLHMVLGILGPVCILFHSNFHLGSLNSTVALVCMLLVAGSGIIGRYLYTRIHFGLYGEKIRLQQVSKDFNELKSELQLFVSAEQDRDFIDKVFLRINDLLEKLRKQNHTPSTRQARKVVRGIAAELSEFITRVLDKHVQEGGDSAGLRQVQGSLHECSAILLAALRKLPGLNLSERLFSLWHVVHIPIFILMIMTAVTHVIAVHMY